MPAKNRNEPRFKPFVGRMFTIRKHKVIPGYPTAPNKNRAEYTYEYFGKVVLILDETNTQVRVSTLNGSAVWISKFFLHKEIENGEFQNVDALSECIQKLLSLAENIKEQTSSKHNIQPPKNYNLYAEELERIANLIRQYSDKVHPTNNEK